MLTDSFYFSRELTKKGLFLEQMTYLKPWLYYITACICKGSRVRAPWDGRLCFLVSPPPSQYWKSPPPPACLSSGHQGSPSYPPVVDTSSVSKCSRILRPNLHRQDLLHVGIFLETFLAVVPSAPEQCAFLFDFVLIFPFILSSECNRYTMGIFGVFHKHQQQAWGGFEVG